MYFADAPPDKSLSKTDCCGFNVYSVAVQIEIYMYIHIMLSVLDLGAVQIEHSTLQHHIALQICIAHCLCSLSTLEM